MAIISQHAHESNPSSFANSAFMRRLPERTKALFAHADETSKSEALYKESKINIINNINLEESLVNNIKTINTARDYSGLKAKVNSDPVFVMLQDWGVGAPFIYAAARDFGESRVKESAQRIAKLREGYFRQGFPIPQQRGRIFNKEMQKLREAKA